MTPKQILDALCEAEYDVNYTADIAGDDPVVLAKLEGLIARRDAIKARMVEFVDASRSEWCWADIPCEKAPGQDCDSPTCKAWRKLEEACRGE